MPRPGSSFGDDKRRIRPPSSLAGLLIPGLCASLLGVAVACVAPPEHEPLGTSKQPVIYGVDDRVEPYAYADAAFAARVREFDVAFMPSASVDLSNPNDVQIPLGPTLAQYYELCPGQRFEDQPTAASCSGTLIASDLVLTAGHCVTSHAECLGTVAVFGFELTSGGTLATISADDVYPCRELAAWVSDAAGLDFAVVRLDRPVVGRAPATLRTAATALPLGTEVVIAGHPSGLPLKIADGGVVNANRAGALDYFMASIDSFEGNSGSGIFLRSTGELVGVLVRGATDYVDSGGCSVVNTCPETGCMGFGEGEDIVYAFNALDAYCDTGGAAPFCACGDGVCGPGETSRTCTEDCGSQCGDGLCSGDETSAACAEDCGTCGNGECESHESDASCCADCGCPPASDEVCIDGFCTPDPSRGDGCADAVELPPVGMTVVSGSTAGALDTAAGGCGGDGVPDRVYHFALTENTRLRAAAQGYDTLLHVRGVCDVRDSEVACNDDRDYDNQIIWAYLDETLPPGDYYLFVDGYDGTGDYVLSVAFGEPANDDCASAQPILAEGTQRIRSSTIPAADDQIGSCAPYPGGRDLIYSFTLSTSTDVWAETSGLDTVLYVRGTCGAPPSELVCSDNSTPPGGMGSHVDLPGLPPGTYYLVVDTANPDTIGPFELTVHFDAGAAPPTPDSSGGSGDDGGCGCTLPGSSRTPAGATLLGALGLGVLARIRRRGARR